MPKQPSIASFFTKSPSSVKNKTQESPRGKVTLKGNEVEVLDLVWAKLEGHPWWPAMVCCSPGDNTFIRKNLIHVQFFDKPPTRGWVKDGLIKPYGKASETGVPNYRDPAWVEAIREAGEAQQLPKEDRNLLLVEMLPSDDDMEGDDDDDAMETEENDSDKSKENVAVNGQNGHSSSSGRPAKAEPKSKRRRIILHSDSESEDDYKPGKDESAGESDDDSVSSGVDEAQVSGPETESEVDSPVKVPGGALRRATSRKAAAAVWGKVSRPPDPSRSMHYGWDGATLCGDCPGVCGSQMAALARQEAELQDALQQWLVPGRVWEGLAAQLCHDEAGRRVPGQDQGQGQSQGSGQGHGQGHGQGQYQGQGQGHGQSQGQGQGNGHGQGHSWGQGQDQDQDQDQDHQGWGTVQQDLASKYMAQQVFVVGEVRLWGGRLASLAHSLTVLLCFNAAGDCRLRPLVVGLQSRPAALGDTRMSALPVVWRANHRAAVTSVLFDDWFVNHFVPEATKYCQASGLAPRCLLLTAPGPGRPPHLRDLYSDIRMAHLPPEAPWPLGQGVATALVHHYLRLGLQGMGDLRPGTSLGEAWQQVGLKMALRNVAVSWELIAPATLNRAWLGLWPQAVNLRRAQEPQASDIAAMARDLGLHRLNKVAVESLVRVSQAQPSEEELKQLAASVANCHEDQGLEEPGAGPLVLATPDLQDILHLLQEAGRLAQSQPGGQELYQQLDAAGQEYWELLAARDGQAAAAATTAASATAAAADAVAAAATAADDDGDYPESLSPPLLLPIKEEEIKVEEEFLE